MRSDSRPVRSPSITLVRRANPITMAMATTFAVAVALQAAAVRAPAREEGPADASGFESVIRPLLTEYCLSCHSTERRKGDVDLERFGSLAGLAKEPRLWQLVSEKVRSGEMPPASKPQPTAEQRAALVASIESELDAIAREHDGDPGPVVLRRLSNAEYTCTVRDLTGVESLDPAGEFPVDGAAGEGFTNVGNALVMSSTLFTKYFDAAKSIADHAMLLEDGIRFSTGATRRDQTEELLGAIRAFYRAYSDPGGGATVNLQGIVLTTNDGGRLPLEKYLAATIELRDSRLDGRAPLEAVARANGLSAKYLATLLDALEGSKPSALLDPIRNAWRASTASDVDRLASKVAAWQQSLWRFSTVGHIGKAGGPKAWMEPVNPLVAAQELRIAIPAAPAAEATDPGAGGAAGLDDGPLRTLYLIAGDAGDGAEHDVVEWRQPRFVAKGRPDLLLRDVRAVTRERQARRARMFRTVEPALAAVGEVEDAVERGLRSADAPGTDRIPAVAVDVDVDVDGVARRHGVDADDLRAWLAYLGLGPREPATLDACFTSRLERPSTHEFVSGWGSAETPLVLANASEQDVRIPGELKAHGIAVHPSPSRRVVVGWRSPVATTVRVDARIRDVHRDCGNGVEWALEARRGTQRQRLASGVAGGLAPADGAIVRAAPAGDLRVRPGDVVALSIGARDGDHVCDTTAVDLTVTCADDSGRTWDLAADCSSDLTAANPHADGFGNAGVWSFSTEPDASPDTSVDAVATSVVMPVVPADSCLDRWLRATDPTERARYAAALQDLLANDASSASDGPDAALRRQLASLGGPLLARAPANAANERASVDGLAAGEDYGLDPARFGAGVPGIDGRRAPSIDSASFCVRAPAIVEIVVPAELVEGCEFVTTGALVPSGSGGDAASGEGSVQLEVRTDRMTTPAAGAGLVPSGARVSVDAGLWTSNNQRTQFAAPVVVDGGSAAERRMIAEFDAFRELFPAALCYEKIVPIDEVVTLTQFYREDAALVRSMLEPDEARRLDRLWGDLHFVAQDALTQVDAFDQIYQFATQDADPKVFEPMREPIRRAAEAFRVRQAAAEGRHVDAVLELADRAWRRPLAASERDDLRALYPRLRADGLAHDEAIRLLLARVLVAPAFLYHRELPGPGSEAAEVSDFELASRLSYFLWSSAPDDELRAAAAAGRLHRDDEILAQARRMSKDPRVRRLATEFGCAWLDIHGFDRHSEKSERHFPTFESLRSDMYEEAIRFFAEVFATNAPVRDLLDADYTFLRQPLAEHYGIPGVIGTEWRRVDGVKAFSRGGILGLGATLAAHSGASRTSPILRGNWVCEALLDDRLPRPPKDVPKLPEDEAVESSTIRELVERHSKDPSCVRCHERMDPFGFALEGFDAIGRHRDQDLGGHRIDARARTMDGAEFEGVAGLREYLLTRRRGAFEAQFCRKLLGYALGRGVQLSDRPLLDRIARSARSADASGGELRVQDVVEAIVLSRQFRTIRGRDALTSDTPDAEEAHETERADGSGEGDK